MKKILFLLAAIIGAGLIALFVLLPANQTLEYSTRLRIPQKALQRTLTRQSMALGGGHQDGVLPVALKPGLYDGFLVSIPLKDQEVHNSQLKLVGLSADSTMAYWSGVVKGGSNPAQRIAAWRKAREVRTQIQHFLDQLRQWEKDEHLYGFKVRYLKVQDSVMIARRFQTPAYPSTRDIYRHIAELNQYIGQSGAQATNPPMLFVHAVDKGFEAQVAVPTNKLLPGSGEIGYRRMVMGNILEAEVRGGQATVDHSIQQLGHYVSDHNLISPAIPFASLVTNRLQEPDTSKWITRIYYPIY